MSSLITPFFMKRLSTSIALIAVVVFSFTFALGSAFAASPRMPKIKVTSPAFKNGKMIPVQYAHTDAMPPKSENISIPISWSVDTKTPAQIDSYAVSIVDTHKKAKKFLHLAAIHIDPSTTALQEGVLSDTKFLDVQTGEVFYEGGMIATTLRNTSDDFGYYGPNPPSGSGKHTYVITVYGLNLDKLVDHTLDEPYNGKDFAALMKGKVVAKGSMKGVFEVKK